MRAVSENSFNNTVNNLHDAINNKNVWIRDSLQVRKKSCRFVRVLSAILRIFCVDVYCHYRVNKVANQILKFADVNKEHLTADNVKLMIETLDWLKVRTGKKYGRTVEKTKEAIKGLIVVPDDPSDTSKNTNANEKNKPRRPLPPLPNVPRYTGHKTTPSNQTPPPPIPRNTPPPPPVPRNPPPPPADADSPDGAPLRLPPIPAGGFVLREAPQATPAVPLQTEADRVRGNLKPVETKVGTPPDTRNSSDGNLYSRIQVVKNSQPDPEPVDGEVPLSEEEGDAWKTMNNDHVRAVEAERERYRKEEEERLARERAIFDRNKAERDARQAEIDANRIADADPAQGIILTPEVLQRMMEQTNNPTFAADAITGRRGAFKPDDSIINFGSVDDSFWDRPVDEDNP